MAASLLPDSTLCIFPSPLPFIFSSVPFLLTYLSCSPSQVGISTKKTIPTMKYNEIYPLVKKHNYLKWPFIVDLPIKNGDFHSYVSLPEGSLVANQLSQPTESHISSLMDDLVGEFLGTPYCFCQTVTFMSSLWKYCC